MSAKEMPRIRLNGFTLQSENVIWVRLPVGRWYLIGEVGCFVVRQVAAPDRLPSKTGGVLILGKDQGLALQAETFCQWLGLYPPGTHELNSGAEHLARAVDA